ncbi:1,5-anhydro-D-fructose reductase [Planctomycetes bacterium CA13]|uniref:1,5-anhydro-D-fructose reductase n=2 Tax=Novipirellula herctigrandis TaxID=2527986 RepID=A0A5C5Z1F6_9BACT|nr:1,5-anhydro-D-fructose reductase [Planctomycetes bacterium CA13]
MQKNVLRAAAVHAEEVPAPRCNSSSVLVANCHSIISPGTESTAVGSSKRDMVVKAIGDKEIRDSVVDMLVQDGVQKTSERVQYEMTKWTPLGYSGAGIAIEVGSDISGIRQGDLVAYAGQGHAEIIHASKRLCVPVPPGVTSREACLVAIGSIALQAVRRSQVSVGDTVALIGLGLVGQLVAQLLQNAGVRVFATDLLQSRVDIAKQCGVEDARIGSESATRAILDATRGMGVDGVVICAATSNPLLQLACKMARERGRITIVGGGPIEVPRHDFYMKELDLVISRSYGPGRYDTSYEESGIDYPYAYVRWTEQRNMEEFLRLIQTGKVKAAPLITHEFELEEANAGYALLMERPNDCLGIALKYDGHQPVESPPYIGLTPATDTVSGSRLRVAAIGCGAFARQFHLPNIKASNQYSLEALVASTAQSAKEFGNLYGASKCSTDASSVWQDERVDAAMIFTRDLTHATFAEAALVSGKHVFCEKPLAVNRDECLRLLATPSNLVCMTGFNRRFAPMMQTVKSLLEDKQGPKQITYRVNAGSLPATSWVLDPGQSAGRIVGEACHFVDLFRWLVGCDPTRVSAITTGTAEAVHAIQDVTATFEFPDGSTAVLVYSSLGTSKFGKERLEVFAGGTAIAIDDFRSLTVRGGSDKDVKHRRIDKGHGQELKHFADVVQGKSKPSIQLRDGIQATMCCLAILESIRTRTPIDVEFLVT